ncbi:MAG: SIMPL domain-containing protein [Bacteroidota bacterium]
MKKIFSLIVICVSVQTLVDAQVNGNAESGNSRLNGDPVFTTRNSKIATIENDSEITIRINGLLNAVADSYVATFNIVQGGKTPAEVDQLMIGRINKFLERARKVGIDSNDIKVDMISFIPKFEYKLIDKRIFSRTYNEVPDGFELQKNITVRYTRPAVLEHIVSAAAEAEIYDLVKVDYYINDVTKNYETLRTKCLELLKSRVKTYELVGFRLDTLKKVFADEFSTILPQTRYAGYQAFSRPSIDISSSKVLGVSDKVYEMRHPTTRFYNAVNVDAFDLVINPVVDEPVVQLTYSIVVKYFQKKPQTPGEKGSYFIITPQGDIRPLDMR